MKRLLNFTAHQIARMDTKVGQQAVFDDLAAREAGFESAVDQALRVSGQLPCCHIDEHNITVGVDINDERVVFRFDNVYDDASGEHMNVAFFVDPELVVR